jgi:hypothetical protein
VLRWSGASIDEPTLQRLVREQMGAEIGTMRDVGQLDPSADAESIRVIAQETGTEAPILLVVPSWEPPTAEYRDLLTELRAAAGERRPIRVLLYNERDGEPAAPEPEDRRQWHTMIAAGGDANVSIAALTEAA